MAVEYSKQPQPHLEPIPSASAHQDGQVSQIPRNLDHDLVLIDSTSDENDLPTDDDYFDAVSIASNADVSSIIGVSIGQDQNLMKSPTTPATTKAQALEKSSTYFPMYEDTESVTFEDPSTEGLDSSPGSAAIRVESPESSFDSLRKQTPSPAGDRHKHEKRASLVGSILGTSSVKFRQRSSSGSLWMGSIRKILPSMPSMSQSGPGSNEKLDQHEGSVRVLGPAGPGIVRQDRSLTTGKATPSNKHESNSKNEYPIPTSGTSNPAPFETVPNMGPYRPSPLRRVTSDQSLYIRRAPTGASQFDDYNNFADVSEMVNSRFKAITDSFQDSSIRMPKMLSMNRGDNSSVTDAKRSHATASNTMANTGISRSETLGSAPNTEGKTSDATNSSRHPMIKDALSQISGDLIILGGYRGSVLREAQAPHRQLWVPVKVGLNLRKADLEVGLTREDELRMDENIVADGTLSHIGPVDICRRLIKKCRKCPNVKEGKLRIHDYGYDWRLSPDLLAERYIAYLESLPCNQKHLPPAERGAWIIAHSLGGLITRNAINRRPDLFAGVVYAGTPQNCVNILGPLRNGDDVLFSSRVLTAQVNFTLRTSYALLPEDGRCFINKQTGERYDLDIYNVKTWEEYRLSPCIRAALHRQKPEKRHSILGSTPDSSSISSRYSAWFSNTSKTTTEDPSTDKSTPQKIKEGANDVKHELAETAETVKPDGPLSPSLSNGQHSKPSIATTSTIPLSLARPYLQNTLTQTLMFKQSLYHSPGLQARNAYPPAAVLFAKNTPTVYGAFVESREDIKYDDAFDELAFAAGDGVVLASAAQLPAGYRCVLGGRVESDRGHVGLLGDIEGVGKCLLAIIGARRKGVGKGAHEEVEERGTRVV